MKIGLVRDYNAIYLAHRAIPDALTLASQQLEILVTPAWIPTDTINTDDVLSDYDGIRFVPDSQLAIAYGTLDSDEMYHCNYGLNPVFADALTTGIAPPLVGSFLRSVR